MVATTTNLKISDAQRKCFFGLIKNLGWTKDEAYLYLGIKTIRNISQNKMGALLETLQRAADGENAQQNKTWIPDDQVKEVWEQWRSRFFPQTLTFGQGRGGWQPSIKQQDFIIYLAINLFRNMDAFATWLEEKREIPGQIGTRSEANSVIRGLEPWAQREGKDVAPPAHTVARDMWEYEREGGER